MRKCFCQDCPFSVDTSVFEPSDPSAPEDDHPSVPSSHLMEEPIEPDTCFCLKHEEDLPAGDLFVQLPSNQKLLISTTRLFCFSIIFLMHF